MKGTQILAVFCGILLMTQPALAYKLLDNGVSGGTPRLQKKTYKVYVQSDPTSKNLDDEVKEAINKWKTELAQYNITLSVQSGDPPQPAIDMDKFNKEIEVFNKDPDQGTSKFPELTKLANKNCTINVYFESTAMIQARGGGGTERGLANNFFDANNNMEAVDILVPTDPPAGTLEVLKRQIHNITMHEVAHGTGLDHYTPAQFSKGEVLKDATLHSDKLSIGDEEKKGLKELYEDKKPKLKIDSDADQKESTSLPLFIQDEIPDRLASVWEYNYDLLWLEGNQASNFQVDIGGFDVFAPSGSNGLEDWLFELPEGNEQFLNFYADSNYLGGNVFSGRLTFYSGAEPGTGLLAYSGGTAFGHAPVPEPATAWLLGSGLLVFMRRCKKFRGQTTAT